MYGTDHTEELLIVFLDIVEMWIHRTSSLLLEGLIRNGSQYCVSGTVLREARASWRSLSL